MKHKRSYFNQGFSLETCVKWPLRCKRTAICILLLVFALSEAIAGVYSIEYHKTVYVGDEFTLSSDIRSKGRSWSQYSEYWNKSQFENYFTIVRDGSYSTTFRANAVCSNIPLRIHLRYKVTQNNSWYIDTYDITWYVTAIERPLPTSVNLNDTIIDIPQNSTYQLRATVLPTDALQPVTWTTNVPEIATVDENGLVTGVGIGDAVITVTSNIDNSVFKTCNVHVGTTDVQTISIPSVLPLHYGNKTKITPVISPSYAIFDLKWQSNDENVATVDQSGNITGVGPGETIITVTDNLTNVQATCTVSVTMVVGDTFKANMSNGTSTVSTTFMLTDLENRYVSIGDGTSAAIATATTGSITIPETIVGPGNLTYTVTSIGSKAFASSKISSVTIPSGITAIGDNAFNGCSSLTSVTVESTEPLAINSTCFSVKAGATLNVPKGCYGVYKTADVWKEFGNIIEPLHTNGDTFAASITAGSGTTDAVFKVIDATNKYVSVGRGVIDDSYETAIDDWTGGEVVILSTVTGYDGQTYLVKQISDGAFFGCFEITSIELPDGIITIGRDAFYQCARLTSFTIPATVATIGDGAFNGCNNITSINIPSNVTSLGTWAFAGCSKLTSVTVNRSEPLAIDDKCFTNAKNATLNVPKGAYKKYASAENWKNFKTIKEPAHSVGDTFAASVTASGSQVDATFKVTNTSSRYVGIGDAEDAAIDIFASGNVVIPSSVKGYDAQTYTVKAVSDAAFFGCENITSVSLPSGITGIGNSSFLRCCNLASINIPTNVTKIGTEAFFYCEKLTSISISKNVTSIGTRAFKNCSQLTSVTVNWATPITIDNECFSNAANATLNVPYGSKERYEAATGWKQFKNIVEMAPKDGDIFTALTTEGVKMTFTVINASAKTCKVGDGSSASISASTDGLVTIPTTANDFAVTQISSKAFYNCNQITATEIPICITSIGTYAFSGCNNLTSVTVGWDEPISISTNCFSNAANATLYVPIGRNKYYKAATGWKDFEIIANKTESRLFADDVIVCRGGQIILPINLSNEEAIRQVHFELSLPAGISVATGQQATLTQRANSTHIITANPLSNGNYEFNIMSKSITSDKTIEGTEGCIANIYLKVWKSTAPNDYGIGLTDCELSIDGTSSALLLSDSQSKLTVSNVMLGDTNDDERISVTDISNIIDYILHKQVDNFVLHAADVNGDGRLTVTDISTIIDIILHKVVFEETQATRKEELDQQ